MKASDYIVTYLIDKGITDVFGYPGGMVTHLMDSFGRFEKDIRAHVSYNEQGAAMAACGYAQASGKTGVAYATSGPGATNMITGICNAYMDSIPTLYITGQVNSFEQKGALKVRQRGFQETDIVSMVSAVTKFAAQVNSAEKLKWYLDYAFHMANEGRKGPVLLDIAMDVFRSDIAPDSQEGYSPKGHPVGELSDEDAVMISNVLQKKRRPVLLLGNGLARNCNADAAWKKQVNRLGVPVVSSMIAVDIRSGLENFYGFIGAYGDRAANFVVAKSDLIIAVGARLDIRQVGAVRKNFAPGAVIIRIDLDPGELEYKVHDDEMSVCADANSALTTLLNTWEHQGRQYSDWRNICNRIRNELGETDSKKSNEFVKCISSLIPSDSIITTDVGQNQVWVAQSFIPKENQRILFSGGHGAMGYSLPAAIGACMAAKRPVYSFNGDGGIQMNIQEFQAVAREQLPVKIIIFNNNALGMIRHFQEMYFEGNYFQTIPSGGFTSPDFGKLAGAYGLPYLLIKELSEVDSAAGLLLDDKPAVIEIQLFEDTYVLPKLEYGRPNQDQEPLLDRMLYERLMAM